MLKYLTAEKAWAARLEIPLVFLLGKR